MNKLPYDPASLPRELTRHYISASEGDIQAMLSSIGVAKLEDLFGHLPQAIRMAGEPPIGAELLYPRLQEHLETLAAANAAKISFLGDGLPSWRVPALPDFVASLRELTTSYTPYQPERSQGTLMTHWIYQCLMATLTGFEAVNASLYDRATALFEAIQCARRLVKGGNTVLVSEAVYPGDLAVLRTLAEGTSLVIRAVPLAAGGVTDAAAVQSAAKALGAECFAVVFPQVACTGNLEDVHALSDLAAGLGVKAVGVFDPMLLGGGGLVPPVRWGQRGVDLVVAEGQHLCMAPNFGGPGLGVFGIRHNAERPNEIRATSGRFVGKAKDLAGRECRVMVLSTREQHIRREKANSNICSNEAFIATMAGAALLARGEKGLKAAIAAARANAASAWRDLTAAAGVKPAFPGRPFWNEFALELPVDVGDFIRDASAAGIQAGVDISARVAGRKNLLLLSFTDLQGEPDLKALGAFFAKRFGPGTAAAPLVEAPAALRREGAVGFPDIAEAELRAYYTRLASQNVSPDSTCYPLGSCTMKYNPYLNDYAAGLEGFQRAHPQSLPEDVQGALEVIYRTQENFKSITGLAALTTQPVAGAQGELVGIKLFQAYHRDRGDAKRNLLLIPHSAHGTNPATAAVAGFSPETGIAVIEADASGQVDLAQLRGVVAEHGPRIAGIMCTNPNTSGIFETRFKELADIVHAAGGLVYMDGANMNAICGWADLGKMGVDAVHNNTHKTWSIPHGGGGPGDAFVAVSEKLVPFLPGMQVVREGGKFLPVRSPKSIGDFHRHQGNFAHKVRAHAYVAALGGAGVRRISALAVLSARYLQKRLEPKFPVLPSGSEASPRMHEFILTLAPELFAKIEATGVTKAQVMGRMGKLFLDFGFHAPTVSFPEVFGLMIEPTESYTKAELDRFADCVLAMHELVSAHPEVLKTVPHFTPVDRVDEVSANKNLVLSEKLAALPEVLSNRLAPTDLQKLPVEEIQKRILAASRTAA
ncbi:MAG: aminomethyl-transferring glycine dehydrogenase subunit GcvPB [Spirochaetes bacterium]|nr:aminomethyl-transferring glycine dehydrogenase subunit GcvPB [Spirochaetota bacterium]